MSTSLTTLPNPVNPVNPVKRTQVLTFAIPPEEAARYTNRIPIEELDAARTLLAALAKIHAAPKVLPACKQLAAGLNRRGWSPHTLKVKYYDYLNGTAEYPAGDWRIVLNKAKARIDSPAILHDKLCTSQRTAFVEFWRGLGEKFHQDWAAAHDELLKIWRTGFDSLGKKYTVIPGYNKWPEADTWLGHPAGWSYANLMRYQSDPYDQVAARIGHAKASEHRVPVLTTRVGLQFGQFMEFDDHEFNQRVLFQKKPMRPLGFGAVEVLSACICHIGLKPTLWDFEEEVKRKLTEREFMWFVVALLTHVGYRQDIGTTLIVERGTAAIRSQFQERLLRVGAGKLEVHVGGRFGKPAHAGQFEGRSKGNFRTKKLIEGSWALVDNQTAMLPAQTGRGRDDAPEGFAPKAGAEQYTNRLLRAVEALPPDSQASALSQLQFPYPMYHQWREWALDAIHRINIDQTHDLEGWEKLNFVQPLWRLSDTSDPADPANRWLPWQQYLALPEDKRAIVKSMLDANPRLLRPNRLSRQDVFNTHRHLLTPLPWELLPELVGPENALNAGAEPLEVKAGLFRFECADIDPDPIEFYARDYRASAGNFLSNGSKYIAFVNPYCPTHLVACEQSGESLRVVAVCPRYVRALRTDEQAINKLLGDQSAFEAAARARLNLRHADQAADKQSMLAHNAAVLGESAPSRPRRDPRLKDFTGDVSELADSSPSSPGSPISPTPTTEDFVEPPQPGSAAEPPPEDSGVEGLL